MANIIRTLIPFFAADRVGIYDQSYTQLFRQARPIKVTVKETAKVMEHPIETGATITDHRVIEPVEIEMSLVIATEDFQDVYRSIRQYFLNGTLLVIQTKSGTYDNQLIAAMPHEEDNTMYDGITLAISFKQALFVTPQYRVNPRSPRHSTRVNRGTQQGTPSSVVKSSAAALSFDKIRGWFS